MNAASHVRNYFTLPICLPQPQPLSPSLERHSVCYTKNVLGEDADSRWDQQHIRKYDESVMEITFRLDYLFHLLLLVALVALLSLAKAESSFLILFFGQRSTKETCWYSYYLLTLIQARLQLRARYASYTRESPVKLARLERVLRSENASRELQK